MKTIWATPDLCIRIQGLARHAVNYPPNQQPDKSGLVYLILDDSQPGAELALALAKAGPCVILQHS